MVTIRSRSRPRDREHRTRWIDGIDPLSDVRQRNRQVTAAATGIQNRALSITQQLGQDVEYLVRVRRPVAIRRDDALVAKLRAILGTQVFGFGGEHVRSPTVNYTLIIDHGSRAARAALISGEPMGKEMIQYPYQP